MKTKFSIAVLALAAMPLSASTVVRHHYGTAQGLAYEHVRDILQDSRGYVWFATWTGIDRFDGYEFVNYRTFSGDSVRLDNNRIERLAENPSGKIVARTYTGRVYTLDPSYGTFSLGTRADSLLLETPRRNGATLRPELDPYHADSLPSMIDRDHNLWVAPRTGGVDYYTVVHEAFEFIDSTPLDSLGRDIHAIHRTPDGNLWAASRDTRTMLYDKNLNYVGSLAPDGSLRPDPATPFGLKVYAFASDRHGRLWLGTKDRTMAVLTPQGAHYSIDRYTEEDGLTCADVYDFAEDGDGNMWLGTFGGGVARAVGEPGKRMSFVFPQGYPEGKSARIRRLFLTSEGFMVAATTDGIIAFDPAATSAGKGNFRHYTASPLGFSALSTATCST